MKKILLLLVMTLIGSRAFAADTLIEVIPLTNRPASELLPLLAPLLSDSAQLVDNGSNLLVKTTPDRLADIKTLIKQLDIRQSNLIITVMQSRHTAAEELNNAANHRLYQTEAKAVDQTSQSIQTLEGTPAYIKAGKIYTRDNFSAYGYPGTVELIEATTGFTVTPQLMGQQVILSVAPWSGKMNGEGQIDMQNTQAKIRVNLGEWVELGSSGESGHRSDNASIKRRQTDTIDMRTLIKIERGD